MQKKVSKKSEKKKEPADPDTVFFGLIFVNFFPLNNFPINNPPISERIETKIVFATIIEIDGDLSDKKSLEEIILIKIPNEIYPEIRSLFVLLFEKSGFNKIKIEEKIDFNELYLKRVIQ